MKHEELTSEIIGIFYDVYTELGHGFLEKVYQNAFYYALLEAGFRVEPRKKMKVHFRNRIVGEYIADLVVNETVILELKAAECLVEAHENQLLHYLRCTEMEVGLLFNFGIKPEFKRKVYDNDLKPNLKKSK
jgi:GxxExxY protein